MSVWEREKENKMSTVKTTISVEQIASPILMSSSELGSIRSSNTTNATENGGSSGRLPKNKSYSFLISKHLMTKRNFNTSDSMIAHSRTTSNSSIEAISNLSKRNFVKSKLS